MRHTGGLRIQPGSFDEAGAAHVGAASGGRRSEAVTAARERLAASSTVSAPDQHLRRLTHSQYSNTVRDLLQRLQPAGRIRFPPEDFVNGFKNQLRTQGMPPLAAGGLQRRAPRSSP